MGLTATATRPNPRTAIKTAKQAAGSDVFRRRLKVFAATEPLFSLGDPKTALYLIESGVVTVYEPRLQGRGAIIEFAFPGDIVGLGFLQTHTCSARASVETVAYCAPFSAQDRLVGDDPRSQAALANAIEREFEFLRRSSIKFSRESPLGRVAAFLLTLSRQNEEEGRDPTLLTQPLQCGVVADFLALSIDRLGGLLIRLERRGIIAQCPPYGLRLTDLNALTALVDETSLNKVTSSNMDRVPLPPKRGPGDASLTQSTPSPLGKIEASPPWGCETKTCEEVKLLNHKPERRQRRIKCH